MTKPLDTFLDDVPEPAEIRQRIAANLQERQLLRRVLKLAEDRYRTIALSHGQRQEVTR